MLFKWLKSNFNFYSLNPTLQSLGADTNQRLKKSGIDELLKNALTQHLKSMTSISEFTSCIIVRILSLWTVLEIISLKGRKVILGYGFISLSLWSCCLSCTDDVHLAVGVRMVEIPRQELTSQYSLQGYALSDLSFPSMSITFQEHLGHL